MTGRLWILPEVRYTYGKCRRCGADVHEVTKEMIEFTQDGVITWLVPSPYRMIRGTCEHVNIDDVNIDRHMIRKGARVRVSPSPEELVRAELAARQHDKHDQVE